MGEGKVARRGHDHQEHRHFKPSEAPAREAALQSARRGCHQGRCERLCEEERKEVKVIVCLCPRVWWYTLDIPCGVRC